LGSRKKNPKRGGENEGKEKENRGEREKRILELTVYPFNTLTTLSGHPNQKMNLATGEKKQRKGGRGGRRAVYLSSSFRFLGRRRGCMKKRWEGKERKGSKDRVWMEPWHTVLRF